MTTPAWSSPPERQAAIQWWQSDDRHQARCDACCDEITRDDGFALSGRVCTVVGVRMNIGDELLCAACFSLLRDEPREPKSAA